MVPKLTGVGGIVVYNCAGVMSHKILNVFHFTEASDQTPLHENRPLTSRVTLTADSGPAHQVRRFDFYIDWDTKAVTLLHSAFADTFHTLTPKCTYVVHRGGTYRLVLSSSNNDEVP